MRRSFSALLLVCVALSGCKAKEAFDKATIANDLDKRGTVDLMKEAANDKYNPPADGKLTDAQVQMYLKVREHEKAIAQVAKQQLQQHADAAKKEGEKSLSGMMEGFKGLGSIADLATADIRAAKDLKYNTQEYLWVKGQILTASTTAMTQKIAEASAASMDAMYQQMKKQYDEAKDDTTKKMYADTLASYDKQRQEMAQTAQKEDPALTYNRQLLSKYENVLNAYATELSKFENKPGEVKEGMDKWQKDLENMKKGETK